MATVSLKLFGEVNILSQYSEHKALGSISNQQTKLKLKKYPSILPDCRGQAGNTVCMSIFLLEKQAVVL